MRQINPGEGMMLDSKHIASKARDIADEVLDETLNANAPAEHAVDTLMAIFEYERV